jgi:hypothetical protein
MIKLLEAGDPDQFNRQRVAPFDAESLNLENLTRGQTQQLMEWLKKLGVSCARAGWRHSPPDRVRPNPFIAGEKALFRARALRVASCRSI